jgi:sortase A
MVSANRAFDSHNTPPSRTRWSALRVLQWAALSTGAVLLASWAAIVTAGEVGRRADVANFERSQLISNEPLLADESRPDTSLWSATRVRQFLSAREQVIGNPLAILLVPSLNLTVPVYSTASELHLNRGVGVISGMAPPDRGGNLGLAGHRDGFFRVLKDISAGAVIEVRTHVRVHRYRVASIDVVDASDRRMLADTDDPTITLVTCHPFYYLGDAPQRFIVRGVYLWPSSPLFSHL